MEKPKPPPMRSEWKGGWGLGLPVTWPVWVEEVIIGAFALVFAAGLIALGLMV